MLKRLKLVDEVGRSILYKFPPRPGRRLPGIKGRGTQGQGGLGWSRIHNNRDKSMMVTNIIVRLDNYLNNRDK